MSDNIKRIKQLDKQIAELQQERRKLALDDFKSYQGENTRHVGRCFSIDGGRFAIITGTPRDVMYKNWFPCFMLDTTVEEDPDEVLPRNNGIVPFYEDALWFDEKTGFGDMDAKEPTYKEISRDEFVSQFAKHIRLLIDRVSDKAEGIT